MNIKINIQQIIKRLSLFAIVLIIIHIGILIVYFYINNPDKFDYVRMFDLDMEGNIPTLFSSALMLISGFLFYLLSRAPKEQQKGHRLYWLGLSFVFIFLAFDESTKIHETLGDYTEHFIDASGYLHYPWVISYSILVLILGLFYIRFFWQMESRLFWSFMGSAAMFLSGALGFELLGAQESSIHSADTILYCVYYTIEESLEMFGVIYLIYILLNLLKGKTLEVQ
jgi:cytochrome bd-type quinol oxidase subunit 2